MLMGKINRLRETVTEQFQVEIPVLVEMWIVNQSDYATWHYRIYSPIRAHHRF